MAATKPAPRSSGRADADELVTLFPGALGAWELQELERPLPPQFPEPRPLVRAAYAHGADRAEIAVRTGPPGGVAKGVRSVYREAPPQRHDTMVVISLANGVSIAATSRTADAAALEALLRAIDLGRAESLKPAKR